MPRDSPHQISCPYQLSHTYAHLYNMKQWAQYKSPQDGKWQFCYFCSLITLKYYNHLFFWIEMTKQCPIKYKFIFKAEWHTEYFFQHKCFITISQHSFLINFNALYFWTYRLLLKSLCNLINSEWFIHSLSDMMLMLLIAKHSIK